MKLAKLAIHQPVFISMVLLAVTLVGALSYMRMGVDLYPDISNPVVSVMVSYPGASPQDVETLITKPMEKALSSISGVDSISATSRQGSSMVMVVFVVGYDIEQGAQDVRERVEATKRRLPESADEPTVRRFDMNSQPFMNVAMSIQGATLTPIEMQRMVQDIIEPRLERVAGVAAVNINGLFTEIMAVDLNASKLKALGVSPLQVVSALSAENTATPSGQVNSPTEQVPLRTAAEFKTPEDVGRVIVSRQSGRAVQLQEVATVTPRVQEKTSYTRVNGQETMVFELQKQSGSNVVETATLARKELDNIARDFPQVVFNIISDDSTFIRDSDRDVTNTLIIGAILAGLIVLVFFRNLRNTLITIAGLPVVVIGTFAAISLLGYTRNIITLMALSLSIGLLIDDAIVVRENIFRHMENGEGPRVASEKATGEIAFAVLAISLTVIAVFVPVAFTSGQVGRLFKEFGITVAIAVLISLFEAFTFAPMLSAYLAKPFKHTQAGATHSRLGAWLGKAWTDTLSGYRRLLGWSLHHRALVLGGATAIFALGLWLTSMLPFSFFPTTDPHSLNVNLTYPPGTTLTASDRAARELEKVLLDQPERKLLYTRVNAGSVSVQMQLKPDASTDTVLKRLRGSLAQYGRILTINRPQQFMGVGGGFGGGGVRGRPVQVAVRGPVSLDSLATAADQVVAQLSAIPGFRDVDKSLPAQEPELHVVVDRQRAANLGINANTVAQTLRTLVQGTAATQMEYQDERIDVTVQLRPEDRSDQATLLNLALTSSNGQVPLYTVASIQRGTGPTVLERQNRQSQIVVGANLEGMTQGAAKPIIQQALSKISLPAGVSWLFTGQMAQTENALTALLIALALGLIFVYMVLASQFGSFVHPFTVMAAIPLSAIGAMLALVIAHTELSVVAMIGIILLMGVATKNSILIVDFIIRYRKEGQERAQAVINAGPVRLRPILMTSLAIILGMVPTAIGFGAAGEFRAPMAIAVIGGVFSSTILSLVVVPVVYTLIDDIMLSIFHIFRRENVAISAGESTEIGRDTDMETARTNGGRGRRHWWLPW